MVHAGHRQQGRDRRVLGVDAAVGEDDDVDAVADGRADAWRQTSSIARSSPAPPVLDAGTGSGSCAT